MGPESSHELRQPLPKIEVQVATRTARGTNLFARNRFPLFLLGLASRFEFIRVKCLEFLEVNTTGFFDSRTLTDP